MDIKKQRDFKTKVELVCHFVNVLQVLCFDKNHLEKNGKKLALTIIVIFSPG